MATASKLARFVAGKEWPEVQRQKKYADGAFWFSCAGHGGTVVLLDRFSESAKAILREAGLVTKVVEDGSGRLYYSREYKLDGYEGVEVAVGEEDCDWAVLFVADPRLSAGYEADGKKNGWLPADYDIHAQAVSSAKSWNPDEYTALTGEAVEVEDSYALRKLAFKKAHENDYVTRAAYGEWHNAVPEGKVGVYAVRETDGDEAYFLVDKDEYAKRNGSFVVDTERHARVAGWS